MGGFNKGSGSSVNAIWKTSVRMDLMLACISDNLIRLCVYSSITYSNEVLICSDKKRVKAIERHILVIKTNTGLVKVGEMRVLISTFVLKKSTRLKIHSFRRLELSLFRENTVRVL
jgi:hypothetical protein